MWTCSCGTGYARSGASTAPSATRPVRCGTATCCWTTCGPTGNSDAHRGAGLAARTLARLPGMAERMARIWFGTTALAAILGLLLEVWVSVDADGGYFTTPASRMFNLLFYFTIQSNIIIAVTTLLLAVRVRRWSPVFRYFWLAGIVSILITAIVYHAVLAQNAHFTGVGEV